MLLLSLAAWVDPSAGLLYRPRVCITCSYCHSQHEWTHLWVGCICLECALYALVVTLGLSGPICEWAVSASSVHYMLLLSLSVWVDSSVSWLYRPRVCITCSCCHSRREWTHLWVGCICLVCALYVLLTLGMSGPICEWAVSALNVRSMFSLSLLAWVNSSVSGLYWPHVCIICSCCHSRREWTHVWVGCIYLVCALYVLLTLGMSGPICGFAVSASRLHYMLLLSLSGWVNSCMSGLYRPRVCIICSCCHSRYEWTHLWVGCIGLDCALYVLVTLGMSGPICESAVSALIVHYMFFSLSAWVDPSVGLLYWPRVCITCYCCHSRHEWTHVWVGCIGITFALHAIVVTLGMSELMYELAVLASRLHYMLLLSLSAWVNSSVSGLYLPRVCIICSCCHSRHEWTHLWVGCICLECALYVLVVTLGMSGPICEWAVYASSVHYMLLLSLSAWVDLSVSGLYMPRVCIICSLSLSAWMNPSVSELYLPRVCVICSCCHSWHEWTNLWLGCISLEYALYVLLVTLGVSELICEWAVSTSCVRYMFLLSLSAWVDPYVSGLYQPWICALCSPCHSRREWTHLWVGCICLECALYALVVTLGLSGPICELAVSTSCVHYMFSLSLSAWVDPSVSRLYLPRLCVICFCCHSRHEWTHLWVGCIGLVCAVSASRCITCSCCHSRHEWTHLWVGCIGLVCAVSASRCITCSCCHSRHEWTYLWVSCICLECSLYALVVTLGMSEPICELAVLASRLHYMLLLSLSAWVNSSVSGLYLPRVCIICSCCHSRFEWTHLWVGCIGLAFALHALVVTLGVSELICEWAVSASCVRYMFFSLSAWVDPYVSGLYQPWMCALCSPCHSWHEWTHLWVGCIGLTFALYALVVTLGVSELMYEWAVSTSCVHYMFFSLSAWVDPSVGLLYRPRVCITCSCCHSRDEWTHVWVGCIGLVCALYALVVTLGMSGPICELAVSALIVHYMFLSLSAWVDPSVSRLYLPWLCIICSSHSRHEWTHLWVCCIGLAFALHAIVVTLGMSELMYELAVLASRLHYMLLLSLSAWVNSSVSGLYLPRVCIICSCCHSRHEWTHLWVGCICLECALYVLVVTLGMSGPICEWAVYASSVHYMLLLSLSAWVDLSVSGLYMPRVCIICSCCHSRHEWTYLWVCCIGLAFALYSLVVTLGMNEPICEWALSASCVCYMFLLSLLAWVNQSVSGLYLPRVCIICSCCHSRHEWTHLWVSFICLVCVLYVLVVTLGMSELICEWAVSASSVHYMLLLSLSVWVDSSVSWLYRPRVCITCSCCHSRREWTHLWVGCICLVCALYVLLTLGMSGPICEWAVSALNVRSMFSLSLLAWVNSSVSGLYWPHVCIICSCCHSRREWTHVWVGCIYLVCALYVLLTLGMSGPICGFAVSASRLHYMLLLSLSGWVNSCMSGLYRPRVCIICSCCHSRYEWTHLWVGCIGLDCALYVLVTLGMSGPICESAVSALIVHYMFFSLSAWVDPSVGLLYRPRVCITCYCCHSRHEWTHVWVGCIGITFALHALVVTLGVSELICEWAVSTSCVHYMFLLSLSAWVDPSVSGLYMPRVCIICSCCHSRHEWTHLWVGCICLECALYALVVTLGMSGPICEWAVYASSVHYMFLLSLSAWVDPSVSGLYMPRVCIICSCCHSRHEWTYLWVGCICLECALYAYVVTLGMSGPICGFAVSDSRLHYMLLLSLSAWVNSSVSGLYLPRVCIICSCCHSRFEWTHLWVGCIGLAFALHALVVTLGMSELICEWAVSASSVHYMLLLSLSAWVDPSVSWLYRPRVCCIGLALHYMLLLSLSAWVDLSVSELYLPRVFIICSCCHSWHEWTNLWVGCIGLTFALHALVVTLGMSELICEWAVSASSVHYMLLLSLSVWVDPSVSGLYLPRVWVLSSCCYSRYERTHCGWTVSSVLSRLLLHNRGVLDLPILYCANIPPYQCFRGCCTPHKCHGIQSRSVFKNYYRTVLYMQVHSN